MIGFICPFWLPMWGGAEQYHSRMAYELQRKGFTVGVFCGTSEAKDKDNGSIPVERFVPYGDITFGSWTNVLQSPSEANFHNLTYHYEFMKAAIKWVRQNKIKIVFVGNPFNDPYYYHAREMYSCLRELNVTVGLIHHDLSGAISENLRSVYPRKAKDWTSATNEVVSSLQTLSQGKSFPLWTAMACSPLFFEPDFMITNTEWCQQLIDPLNQCQKIVLHPLMDQMFWQGNSASGTSMSKVDVLMVNPQSRKNPKLMKEFIENAPNSMTFRVLKGGWGDSFSSFRKLLADLPERKRRNVELLEYVEDMRTVYRSARLLLFPSYEEGYGMTPVEAMYCGVPVLSSNFPAIKEAVGDGAKTLCPYKTKAVDWVRTALGMLDDLETWVGRSLKHVATLVNRQEQELENLCVFLNSHRSRESLFTS